MEIETLIGHQLSWEVQTFKSRPSAILSERTSTQSLLFKPNRILMLQIFNSCLKRKNAISQGKKKIKGLKENLAKTLTVSQVRKEC